MDRVGQRALEMTLLLAAPLLLVALVTGLIVGAFQAATQINEMTLSFIPKLMATAATLVIAGPWMLKLIVGYTRERKPVRAKELNANGAMAALLKDAIAPNLVQTLEGTPYSEL